jgi:hypothetical protein
MIKIKEIAHDELYAIAIATGTSSTGNHYQNVIVSPNPNARRSSWSLYINPDDPRDLDEIGNPTLEYNEDGTRKVVPLIPAVKLTRQFKLLSVKHAPYNVNDRRIETTSVICEDSENATDAAYHAVQRGMERADFLYKNPAYYAEYHEFLAKKLTLDEFFELIEAQDALPD